jgi:hypothetical protein
MYKVKHVLLKLLLIMYVENRMYFGFGNDEITGDTLSKFYVNIILK